MESDRAWSTAQVARLSGVTSRTLRHYDEIGLLPPARVGGNGYRYYERPQLLRLQRILLLRALGVGLEVIGRTLDGERDTAAALRAHHRQLLVERDRFDRLASTVARTIAELEGGTDVPAEEIFTGFEEVPYEEEVRERWGADTLARSKEQLARLSPDQQRQVMVDEREICRDLAALLGSGAAATDEAVQRVVDRHYQWLSHFWTASGEAYRNLADMYSADARFAAHYDRHAPGLAVFLRDAIHAYAAERLS